MYTSSDGVIVYPEEQDQRPRMINKWCYPGSQTSTLLGIKACFESSTQIFSGTGRKEEKPAPLWQLILSEIKIYTEKTDTLSGYEFEYSIKNDAVCIALLLSRKF